MLQYLVFFGGCSILSFYVRLREVDDEGACEAEPSILADMGGGTDHLGC